MPAFILMRLDSTADSTSWSQILVKVDARREQWRTQLWFLSWVSSFWFLPWLGSIRGIWGSDLPHDILFLSSSNKEMHFNIQHFQSFLKSPRCVCMCASSRVTHCILTMCLEIAFPSLKNAFFMVYVFSCYLMHYLVPSSYRKLEE